MRVLFLWLSWIIFNFYFLRWTLESTRFRRHWGVADLSEEVTSVETSGPTKSSPVECVDLSTWLGKGSTSWPVDLPKAWQPPSSWKPQEASSAENTWSGDFS